VINANRINAQNMLDHAIAAFGLSKQGWSRGPFTKSRSTAGVTRFYEQGGGMICLSGPITDVWPLEQTRLTILHEVAHALCGNEAGHNATWKRCCLEIGGDGKSCVDARTVPLPEPKYTGFCESGHEIRLHRRLKVMEGRTCARCHTPIQWMQNR
jgi:hypothetical protein